MKIIIMVGIPGSGKSSFAAKYPSYTVINQDLLGSRHKCLMKFHQCLLENKSVIIDRCNHNVLQRLNWIKEAHKAGVTNIDCVYLKVSPEIALKRISERKNHPTIKETTSKEKCEEIITGFLQSHEPPQIEEGFQKILIIKNE